MVIPSIVLSCTKGCLILSNLAADLGLQGRERRDWGLKDSKFKIIKVVYYVTLFFKMKSYFLEIHRKFSTSLA